MTKTSDKRNLREVLQNLCLVLIKHSPEKQGKIEKLANQKTLEDEGLKAMWYLGWDLGTEKWTTVEKLEFG